jgi:hypothetical protein
LGISGLIALCLYSQVIYDIMSLIFVPMFLDKMIKKSLFLGPVQKLVHFLRTCPLEMYFLMNMPLDMLGTL